MNGEMVMAGEVGAVEGEEDEANDSEDELERAIIAMSDDGNEDYDNDDDGDDKMMAMTRMMTMMMMMMTVTRTLPSVKHHAAPITRQRCGSRSCPCQA